MEETSNKHKVPDKLRERIFEKLFETAEIAKFTPAQIRSYEDSLKYYRDLKNSLDTAREEGLLEGRIEGKLEGKEEGKEERNLEIAKQMLLDGESSEKIMKYTGITLQQLDNLKLL